MSCLQKVVYTCVSLLFPALYRTSGTCGLIVATSKWQIIVMRASEKELEDWHENGSKGRKPKCSHYPMKSVVRSRTVKERRGG